MCIALACSRACGWRCCSLLAYSAQPVVVNNQNYYFAAGTYYQPCHKGAGVNYCVVDNPNYWRRLPASSRHRLAKEIT